MLAFRGVCDLLERLLGEFLSRTMKSKQKHILPNGGSIGDESHGRKCKKNHQANKYQIQEILPNLKMCRSKPPNLPPFIARCAVFVVPPPTLIQNSILSSYLEYVLHLGIHFSIGTPSSHLLLSQRVWCLLPRRVTGSFLSIWHQCHLWRKTLEDKFILPNRLDGPLVFSLLRHCRAISQAPSGLWGSYGDPRTVHPIN